VPIFEAGFLFIPVAVLPVLSFAVEASSRSR
jgi:hypothetical protein